MTDLTIKTLVAAELDWEPSLDAADVGVTVENGVVRLMGHVRTYAQKLSAEAAAKRVKGVRGLVNELAVRTQPEAGSDEAIAERLANLLEWNVSVPRNAVQVKVDKGHVTLTGSVEWAYQRTAAEEAVRWQSGVRGVSNLIDLRPTVRASDIKQRIEAALARQAELEAGHIQVSVEGTTVRLDGAVKAWVEREVIEKAAWAAPGVTRVEDRVHVGA